MNARGGVEEDMSISEAAAVATRQTVTGRQNNKKAWTLDGDVNKTLRHHESGNSTSSVDRC